MGETHEIPHHNLADFEPWLGYATEGQAVGGIPLQNPLEGPQYHPQLHLLHSTTSKNPHAMAEMGKLDHLEERLMAIEGGEDLVVVTWYTNLEPSRVHSWEDLMVAFVRQCQYNGFA